MMHFFSHVHTRSTLLQMILLTVLIQTTSNVQATTKTNYLEMASALAAIPFDMAAHHHTLEGNHKAAAGFGLVTSIINSINKALFFWNYVDGEKYKLDNRKYLGPEIIVNGSLALHNIIMLIMHSRELKTALGTINSHLFGTHVSDVSIGAITPDLLNEAKESPAPTNTDPVENTKVSRLMYLLQVIVLPSLKGLTAFGLACSQEYATPYFGEKARLITTAAHSLTTLLDDLATLKLSSKKKSLLVLLVLANILWLCYELMPRTDEIGHCDYCCNNEALVQLGCGHRVCRKCVRMQLKNASQKAPSDRVQCPEDRCPYIISRNEMQCIATNENREMLEQFDRARYERRHLTEQSYQLAEVIDEDYYKDLIEDHWAQRCPKCSQVVTRFLGFPHMTCHCGQEYCFYCGKIYISGKPTCNWCPGHPMQDQEHHTIYQIPPDEKTRKAYKTRGAADEHGTYVPATDPRREQLRQQYHKQHESGLFWKWDGFCPF